MAWEHPFSLYTDSKFASYFLICSIFGYPHRWSGDRFRYFHVLTFIAVKLTFDHEVLLCFYFAISYLYTDQTSALRWRWLSRLQKARDQFVLVCYLFTIFSLFFRIGAWYRILFAGLLICYLVVWFGTKMFEIHLQDFAFSYKLFRLQLCEFLDRQAR